ncbi:DGQHR domain-containing protein [Sinomonas sp. JGH33]|uniref:DGQHR domain-containing protein n=1 Tax=Sinomonas terricola TaxID=3110330 RepID=A0ABU5TAW2_9MICC|nr:DGQHR domain-containing protein [Sinomonas sp. JGH33]MEA5456823.1 DGQHR domain-containing protein [Sinomonas sp. JGH33]
MTTTATPAGTFSTFGTPLEGRPIALLGVLDPYKEASAAMTPAAMARLLFISNFEETDPESPAADRHGYQRQPMRERIPKIRDFYLKKEPTSRTTPIIVSVRLRDEAAIERFLELFAAGNIEGIRQEFDESVMSVVDGQHRYLGLVEAWTKDPSFCPLAPVSLYFGLDFTEEATFFDVINTEQKKLPKALIEITKADVRELGHATHTQRVRLIATMLARHEESVWHGQVNLTGARDPNKPVTFEGLRRSSASMFPSELLGRLEAAGKDVDEVARMYWAMIAETCAEAWNEESRTRIDENGDKVPYTPKYRIKELVGVASLAKLGKDIITSALEHPNFNERMKSLVGALAEVDWEKVNLQNDERNPWMASQAGFAGQADLYKTLYAWVYYGKKPQG